MLLELFSGLFLLCACVFLCCWDRSRLKTHLEVVFQAHRLLHLNYILTLTPTLTQPSHTSLCILQLSTLTQCQIVLCDAGQSSVLLPVLLVRSPLVLDQPTLSAIVLFGRRFLCDKHLLLSINFLPGGSAFGFTVPPVPLGCCLFSSHGTNLKMDLKLCPSTMSCLCCLIMKSCYDFLSFHVWMYQYRFWPIFRWLYMMKLSTMCCELHFNISRLY